MKFPRKAREPVDINLAPLIDVVFILLLFFVVTTTFTRETLLKIDLPEAVSGVQPEEQYTIPLEILVGQEGNYAVNGKTLASSDLNSLMAALIEVSAGDKELPVTLSADGKAPHQAVVTAMDAASKLGFIHMRITTIEAQESQ
ncbi:ExbD/TolR family protein [Thiopseudomonas acetoxidans]|uniref:Biopolymer transporter ExbD n=1 Tax=Thiopseudomonas acetoxidans TaxID=3041622 RepID=A0ABT7SR00_9GAMM|nr:biopolymer transporter ExbD [Thiopseudomonas sp. CY1220]MDM7858609.1 biopolymer transporter ExbD [Thiopseudomonas sp. CY1220]NLC08360.1 biopolymer transporter ExbD [Gammaproteobacteria bacterium]